VRGRLFVIAGPIGNLEDITLRAIKVLRSVDLILCEDTRRTKTLLKKYEIKTKTLSFNEHNEKKRIPQVIEALERGTDVALMTDAGTPTIQDPGYRLVRTLRENGFEISPIPGPSAVTASLSVSGLPTDRFCFEGFLPRRKGKRRKRLLELREEERTIIIFESVHRIDETLNELFEVFGDREVAICRELTKLHEEIKFGKLSEILSTQFERKGEFVIVVRGKSK